MFERSTSCGNGWQGGGCLRVPKEREKERKAHRNYVLLRDFTVDGTIDEKCSDYKGLRDSHQSRSSFHSWQRFSFTRERKQKVKTAHSKVT